MGIKWNIRGKKIIAHLISIFLEFWLILLFFITQKKGLSVVTKNFQITIPEERGPTPGSREYTYLRLGLEEQITEKDSGVYICRDRILPQNYISIRALVASRLPPSLYSQQATPSQPSYFTHTSYGDGSSSPMKFGTPSLGGNNFPGTLLDGDINPYELGVNPFGLPPAQPQMPMMPVDDNRLAHAHQSNFAPYPSYPKPFDIETSPRSAQSVDMSGVFSSAHKSRFYFLFTFIMALIIALF